MDAALWITAIATAVLALSVPVAWFTWNNARKQDRERRQRERDEAAREQLLKDVKERFVSKDTAQSVTAVAVIGVVLGALAWFGREKP